MKNELDITEADSLKLKGILREHDAEFCKNGHEIGWGDIAWNDASTEAGTGYCTVQIECSVCQSEIVHIDSWYPWIDDAHDILHVLERDWGHYI